MIVADRIHEILQKLPTPLQVEVLDYVEYLMSRWERQEDNSSSLSDAELSLALAMRGMEDEEGLAYSMESLKVVF